MGKIGTGEISVPATIQLHGALCGSSRDASRQVVENPARGASDNNVADLPGLHIFK
jgi:hypothetical protein